LPILKPFKAIRPTKDKARLVASPPYDVLDKYEAREMAKGNPLSFLHIIKPEIDLPDNVDAYSPEVYSKGKENFLKMLNDGIFSQDSDEHLYIYAETMERRTQYGIVGCAAVEEYMNGVIRKHELTRPDKVEDRMNHIRVSGMNYEPVFLAYRNNPEIEDIIGRETKNEPDYDFVTEDGVRHTFWVIKAGAIGLQLVELFEKISCTYIADGHHRTAAAALAGNERKQNDRHHIGTEEYNYFLAVHFPDDQLRIMDYNRVVKDLNGLSKEEFLKRLAHAGAIHELSLHESPKPQSPHTLSLYLDGSWYSLTAKPGVYNDSDPIGCLDVTILTNHVLKPILGIEDQTKSDRIDFVGGIKGLEELKRRVDTGEMAAAFALYPVSMSQLMAIADTGNIMPPKTTWFEPKLRSGLFVHSLG
jgi:uncharacterized protein (DUF1015 family)